MGDVLARALEDARALVEGGMDGLLLENYGDAPFTPARVPPATVAAMAVVAAALRQAFPGVPLGVNVLKNDARAALAVACAAGARFIRVNVHAGVVVADQGLVHGDAYHTLRDRRLLDVDILIFADVHSKHAVPLGGTDLEQQARDLVHRGLADALVVSGRATGAPTAPADVTRVREAVPGVPVLVGSGVTPESVRQWLEVVDGVIVGTALKRDGDVRNPVDPERVRRLVTAARGR